MRTACFVLALLAAPLAARAQEPPGFLLERITVEGIPGDAARQIIATESLLTTGARYSEPQLRDAVYRVKRLPFVVDADMALKKGSQRGAYELVITIEAAKPLFFSIDADGLTERANDSFARGGVDWSAAGTIGARKFVGSRGLVFGSMQGFDASGSGQVVQVGYTRYGLFHGGFATVGLSSRVNDRFSSDDFQTSVQAGVPVVGNHVVRAGFTWTRSVSGPFHEPEGTFKSQFDSWEENVEWIYDSTDDPLMPTEGSRVSGGLVYAKSRSQDRSDPPDLSGDTEGNTRQVKGEARRYWSLTPKQSVGVAGTASRSEHRSPFFDSKSDENVVMVEAVHALQPLAFETIHRLGDLRLESGLGIERFSEDQRFASSRSHERRWAWVARASLLFRNPWGLVKISFFYSDQLGQGV